MQDLIEGNFEFYKQVTDNQALGRAFKNHLFQLYQTVIEERLSSGS